jgi:glycosyltransferase involved in cell wall biosynthesis
VERIDLALAQALVRRLGAACAFVAASPLGPRWISPAVGAALLTCLERRWSGRARRPPWAALQARQAGEMLTAPWRRPRPRVAETTYVNASHAGLLLRRGALDGLDPQRRMARLVYVHDLIPIEHPEYQRPGADRRLTAFLDEAAAAPVRLLTNSLDTARRLEAFARGRKWRVEAITPLIPRYVAKPPASGAPLRPAVRRRLADAAPYFIVIGTIEPRKNHLLLLHIWRDLARHGRPPHLVVVGRRGWENEMVVDMLDRCASIRPHVTEFGDLGDDEVQALLTGARALLFPSFAEGLGMPLLEAAALGTPAIVSDLPALREIAPAGTVFLHPLDGLGWTREIVARSTVSASSSAQGQA